MSRRVLGSVLFAVLLVAPRARAQQPPPGPAGAPATNLPAAEPADEEDPRRGPRLEYVRGPAACLSEAQFRDEVAIAAHDGVDHLDDSSPDVVRVWFEKIRGGYRGTVVYTDANGVKDTPQVHTGDHCHIVARWVASTVSDRIPRPPPTVCPAPPEPTCPACLSCPVCGTPRPPAPCPLPPQPPSWRMDLSVNLSTYVAMTAFFSDNVGPAVAVAGEVRGSIFSVRAEFRVALPSPTVARERVPGTSSPGPDQPFDLSQFTGLLVPCAHYKFFVGCGVAQLGGIAFHTPVYLNSVFSTAFGPRLGFEVPFAERFAVFGFGEALFTPAPAFVRFVFPPPGEPDTPPANRQWRQPVASAFFGAGLSVQFK